MDVAKNFNRSNSFNLRLNYSKQSNIINNRAKNYNITKINDSESRTVEKKTFVEENRRNDYIKGISFSRRERWQLVKNVSEYKELKDLPKKKILSKSVAKWENLIENSTSHLIKPFVKISAQKSIENSLSSRTLNPEIDTKLVKVSHKKLNYPSRLKYKATGSLSNLIECTSNETPKKIANRRQDLSSIIFKPEFEIILPLKRHKSYVNLGNIKKDTSFAGLKSGNKEENIFNKESNLKFSTNKRCIGLVSDIFSDKLNTSFNTSLIIKNEKINKQIYHPIHTSSNSTKFIINKTCGNQKSPLAQGKRKNYKSENLSYTIDVYDNTKRKNVKPMKKHINNPISGYSTTNDSKNLSKTELRTIFS